ncbi:MAG TPA: glycosyltransferase family 4 protein, partial [Thermomicrobiales bacterium]|nr:glycosyltransferase family 4 protein [Thermomicrobiales bacterium]
MAGSGIRYWNLARVLGSQQPVTLAAPGAVGLEPPIGVEIVSYAGGTEDERGQILARLIGEHDIVIAQHLPHLYTDASVLAERCIVVDLYAPWVLEKLEYSRIDPERGEPNRKDDITILQRLLSFGDFFICASERQRDYWLGALTLAGRLDLAHVQDDPSLRNLIDVVPFGLPGPKPALSGPGPREVFPAIGSDDPVLIWNGGLWNWLDPLTAIRATGLLSAGSHPDIRLVFMGTRSPGAQVAEMSMVDDAIALARELDLLDSHVFFNEWTPYHERHNWLLQADIALSLHYPTVEARFSFRTRMLDNLWCELPAIATEGDVLADLVQSEGIGITVPPGDASAVADAVRRLLHPDVSAKVRSMVAAVAERYSWEEITEPLLRFCRQPTRFSETRPEDPAHRYLHDLERLYSETAAYARRLEA